MSELPAPAVYLLTLGLSLGTHVLLLYINGFQPINKTTIALIFLLPVGLSATLWGLVPGILAALTSFLVFNYFFIPPIGSFIVHNSEDLVILAAFLVVTVVISQLVGRVKYNLSAATAREYETMQLYEFSALLASSQNEQTIARVLLEKVDQTLNSDRTEILIETSSEPLLLSKGVSVSEGYAHKAVVEPLQSVRELIGEIRTWRAIPLNEAEQRILKIFASQSSLALERLRLADASRKAKVIEESDRLKSSLLSSVSHELRSPLAAIKASVGSLRSGEVNWDSEARVELLTTVEEEIDHLNMLVGNLLDMSRIEAGVLAPQKKPNLLSEIVNAVRGRMRLPLQSYQLHIDIPDDLPLVNVDFVQIEQVFANLLTNSMKYSPTGSKIEITVAKKDTRNLQVRLTNESMPVPEVDLEKIFDKFYRINPSELITGSGLGLSICKGIIEAHGCTIWAENLSHGLAFNFTLPLL
jgi:two-component system sensor histidine kinase KdpD